MTQKTLTIRINEELHKKIKVKTAKKQISLKDYITNLIENDLKK